MSLIGVRIFASILLFGLTMLVGSGPVFAFNLWQKRRGNSLIQDQDTNISSKHAQVLHLLLVFGGGVLLATCFVHMIPEITENYESYISKKNNGSSVKLNINHESSITLINKGLMSESTYTDSLLRPMNEGKQLVDDHKDDDDDSPPWVEICVCIGLFITYFIDTSVVMALEKSSLNDQQNEINLVENHLESENGNVMLLSARARFSKGLIMVVAFLAHAIFDGVAIGLQSSASSLWTVFFAICLHKFVVVFAIGFELFKQTASLTLTCILVGIFSATSPFGIFLTLILEDGLTEDDSLTIILFSAIATGAILYIVFLEILQAKRPPGVNGLVQLASLVAGFTLMSFISVVVGDGD